MAAVAAARRHYRGLTWLGRARRAGGAPVDDPPATLSTKDNPRDGLPPASEPILPELGPGGTEVTVASSMEHDSNTEEIVDNKTVRIDKEVQPTGTLDDLITCRGCKAAGHVLESCPVDHGLTYTDCQMSQWEQTNAQMS